MLLNSCSILASTITHYEHGNSHVQTSSIPARSTGVEMLANVSSLRLRLRDRVCDNLVETNEEPRIIVLRVAIILRIGEQDSVYIRI